MAGSQVTAVVAATVDLLRTSSDLSGAVEAKVYTYVPQGTATPYVWVLGGEELPWTVEFGPDNGARQVDVVVNVVSTYRGTAEVDQIASIVMTALLNDDAWTTIDAFETVEFIRNTAQIPADVLNDGVLWFLRTVVVRVFLR